MKIKSFFCMKFSKQFFFLPMKENLVAILHLIEMYKCLYVHFETDETDDAIKNFITRDGQVYISNYEKGYFHKDFCIDR